MYTSFVRVYRGRVVQLPERTPGKRSLRQLGRAAPPRRVVILLRT